MQGTNSCTSCSPLQIQSFYFGVIFGAIFVDFWSSVLAAIGLNFLRDFDARTCVIKARVIPWQILHLSTTNQADFVLGKNSSSWLRSKFTVLWVNPRPWFLGNRFVPRWISSQTFFWRTIYNTTYSFQAEDEDVSEASLYDTAEEDEMTEEEVSAASLSGRKRKMRSPTRRWRSQKPRCLKQKWRSQNTSRINNPSVYIISVSEVTIQSILI